ncbi:hypothetical protein [Halopiger djelfimassiliensis]|uniref:hypothetical protein n=1 Tax=Halopiger djelfimassiliensis TaxID=1293047 RepID=UPI000677BB89|nr:hypothetical protein [Halopiger djelfimassiliensis]
MSLATASGIVSSIVPFDLTVGLVALASVMLAIFVLAMVFFAVAPLVSSTWADRLSAEPTSGPSLDASNAD